LAFRIAIITPLPGTMYLLLERIRLICCQWCGQMTSALKVAVLCVIPGTRVV